MIPLLQTARELLQMQPTLHPKIFSADERLLPDVRQKIMEAADFMIRQRVSRFYGLKVADIVIVGSAANTAAAKNWTATEPLCPFFISTACFLT